MSDAIQDYVSDNPTASTTDNTPLEKLVADAIPRVGEYPAKTSSQQATSISVFSEFGHAVYQSGIERPLTSLKQMAEQMTGMQVESAKPEPELHGAMEVARLVGSATGQIVDFMLLNKFAHGALNKVAASATSAAGAESWTLKALTHNQVARATFTSGSVGFVNGAFLTPLNDGQSSARRLGNGLVDAGSFAMMGGLETWLSPAAGAGLVARFKTAAIAGAAGGATEAVLNPLSHGQLPDAESVVTQAAGWAAGGVIGGEALRGAGRGLNAVRNVANIIGAGRTNFSDIIEGEFAANHSQETAPAEGHEIPSAADGAIASGAALKAPTTANDNFPRAANDNELLSSSAQPVQMAVGSDLDLSSVTPRFVNESATAAGRFTVIEGGKTPTAAGEIAQGASSALTPSSGEVLTAALPAARGEENGELTIKSLMRDSLRNAKPDVDSSGGDRPAALTVGGKKGIDLRALEERAAFKPPAHLMEAVNKDLDVLGTSVGHSVAGNLEIWRSKNDEPGLIKEQVPTVLGHTTDGREFVHNVQSGLTLVKGASLYALKDGVVRASIGEDSIAISFADGTRLTCARAKNPAVDIQFAQGATMQFNGASTTTDGDITVNGQAVSPTEQQLSNGQTTLTLGPPTSGLRSYELSHSDGSFLVSTGSYGEVRGSLELGSSADLQLHFDGNSLVLGVPNSSRLNIYRNPSGFNIRGNALAPFDDASSASKLDLDQIFDGDGHLLPGTHHANWNELANTFGTTTPRQDMLHGMLTALNILKEAGVEHVDLFGSFVSKKGLRYERKDNKMVRPSDYDLIFSSEGADLKRLDQNILHPFMHQSWKGDIICAKQMLIDIGDVAENVARRTKDGKEVGVLRVPLDDALPAGVFYQTVAGPEMPEMFLEMARNSTGRRHR